MENSESIALTVCDHEDLIPWILDINLFKEKYPSIYKLKKMIYGKWKVGKSKNFFLRVNM